MSHWAHLIACIRSGQMTEAQVAAELRDPKLAAYARQAMPSPISLQYQGTSYAG